MTLSLRQSDGPLAVLVVPLGCLTTTKDGPNSSRTVRLARGLHPSSASLASTLWTGCWPERHGVIRNLQPHPDRLGYEISRPERATAGSVWSAAACSGRHVSVVNWPHGMSELDLGDQGRFDRVDGSAILGLSGEPPHVCRPGSVDPASIRARLVAAGGMERIELGCTALEMTAEEGPDLMLGWLASIPGEIEDRRAWLERFRISLGEARGREATLLVIEHEVVGPSIYQQFLNGPPSFLHVFGPRVLPISGRPRVDVVPELVSGSMGIDGSATKTRVGTPLGDDERLRADASHVPLRISSFDLKQFDFERNREIGASFVARGRWTEANPWLMSSIQSQHGMIDAGVLLLLLISIRRRHGEQDAARLLSSVKKQLNPEIVLVLEDHLHGRGADWNTPDRRRSLGGFGPFAVEMMFIDLVRRGCLALSDLKAMVSAASD